MGFSGAGSNVSAVVGVESNSGSPPQSVGVIVTGKRGYLVEQERDGRGVDLAESDERIPEDLFFEVPLMCQSDVSEISTAHSSFGDSRHVRLRPDVGYSMLGRGEHGHGVRPPKAGLRIVGDNSGDRFSRDCVGDEDDPAVEARHRIPAVCDTRRRQFDGRTLPLTHSPSLRVG